MVKNIIIAVLCAACVGLAVASIICYRLYAYCDANADSASRHACALSSR